MGLAKLSCDISDLVDADSGKEIVRTPQLVDRFDSLMKKYEHFLGLEYRKRELEKNRLQTVLLPSHINLFLQSTLSYEDHQNYQMYTGFFISKFIQNSYKT